MKADNYPYDLVVLAADKSMESSIKGILERPESIGIRPVGFNIYTHLHRDPGCLNKGHDFLRPFINTFHHALVILDREGCGKENRFKREELENDIEQRLNCSGWGDRAAAIVIDPELENWLWSDSPEVDMALGWKGKSPSLRDWLKDKKFLTGNSIKPTQPKEAVESALKIVNISRSSSIYYKIAQKVSLKRCQDPAFMKLKMKLIRWFA
jgi:hypothetical protein